VGAAEWERAGVRLGRAVVAYATAFLLWLFLLLVYLPASHLPSTEPLAPLIALIFLGGIAAEVWWGTTSLLEFLELAALSRPAKLLATELVVLLDALLLAPPLYAISPALGGACVIVALVVAVALLLMNAEALLELVAMFLPERGKEEERGKEKGEWGPARSPRAARSR